MGVHIKHLQLNVRIRVEDARSQPRKVLLARLAAGDAEGVARLLAQEHRVFDATMQTRLAEFFGHDFNDVRIFAGPMSGALARSLSAEAFTHGKFVFFDPKHFRPDSPHGEALMAHELAHTRQEDDRAPQAKEAEALRTEAAYLDWLQPGGAPFAEESPLDVTAPDAAAAGDLAGTGTGGFRAGANRQLAKAAGPRAGTAELEARTKQILERVTQILALIDTEEDDRLGRLAAHFGGPI